MNESSLDPTKTLAQLLRSTSLLSLLLFIQEWLLRLTNPNNSLPRALSTEEVAQILGMALSTFEKRLARGPESGLYPTPVYRYLGSNAYHWLPDEVYA